jgi:hypothetical protein
MTELAPLPALVAFAAVKFVGYAIAGGVFKNLHPAAKPNTWQIAAMRTGIGVAVGLAAFGLSQLLPEAVRDSEYSGQLTYAGLNLLRILIWIIVVRWAARGIQISRARFTVYVLVGTAWSCFLDIPGFVMAFLVPGGIRIC